MSKLPAVSILIPTLNAASVLEKCLSSVVAQDYPKDRVEIIIADGGSTDTTLKIAKKYGAKVYSNPLKTGESGKAVALRHAQGELIALIDSDNILPDNNWLKKMIEPFKDPEIIGSEPWEFTYRKSDSYINRYCALIGANDPYCYFVGNYDKRSVLSGRWTGLEMEEEDCTDCVKVKIEGAILPTIGANGTFWRRGHLTRAVGKSSYLFDTDIPYILSEEKPFYFAKVKIGIVHLYCRRFRDFLRKQRRRVRDFLYLEKFSQRSQTYQRQLLRQLYFICSVVLVLPLLFQAIKGFIKKPDFAWIFHPIACLMTLWIYASEIIVTKFKTNPMERKQWRQ